jgi:hypothetical protein
MSLRERDQAKPTHVNSYLIAITIIGVVGLALMLGGAIALKNGADFREDVVGIFMLMVFMVIGAVELSLCRQLSRLNRAAEKREAAPPVLQSANPNEILGPSQRALGEAVPSVTENTTRTLQYSRNEP